MAVPKELADFISEEQWNKLRLNRLSAEDRAEVEGFLASIFEGEKPEEWDGDDVSDALEMGRELADMLAEEIDEDISDDDLVAAGHTADAVTEAKAEE